MNTQVIENFVKDYGWQLALVALVGILVVGILKHYNVFDKVAKGNRKFIFFPLSAVISVACCVAYVFGVRKEWALSLDAVGWVCFCFAIVAYTIVVYALYENLGIRNLLQALYKVLKETSGKIISLIIKSINKPADSEQLKQEALKLGSSILQGWLTECQEQEAQQLEQANSAETAADVANVSTTEDKTTVIVDE